MDIIKINDFAVIKTEKEFVLVLDKNIHGPFPNNKEMVLAIYSLIENPESEEAINKCKMAWRNKSLFVKKQ
ncbi:MAG: hypothetical protein Q8934_22000 [Bacillota bacterium]|nr:hypothetical protein [Bacillota bacterium]